MPAQTKCPDCGAPLIPYLSPLTTKPEWLCGSRPGDQSDRCELMIENAALKNEIARLRAQIQSMPCFP